MTGCDGSTDGCILHLAAGPYSALAVDGQFPSTDSCNRLSNSQMLQLNACLDLTHNLAGPVAILGSGSGEATIDAGETGLPLLAAQLSGALYLKGMRIKGFKGTDGGLLAVSGGQLFLQDVEMEGMIAERQGGAVFAENSAVLVARNCKFSNNKVSSWH